MTDREAPIKARTRDGYAILYIPLHRLHAVRVALQPVPAGAAVSTATQKTRIEIDRALAALQAGRMASRAPD